jgi:hypothetical protein
VYALPTGGYGELQSVISDALGSRSDNATYLISRFIGAQSTS